MTRWLVVILCWCLSCTPPQPVGPSLVGGQSWKGPPVHSPQLVSEETGSEAGGIPPSLTAAWSPWALSLLPYTGISAPHLWVLGYNATSPKADLHLPVVWPISYLGTGVGVWSSWGQRWVAITPPHSVITWEGPVPSRNFRKLSFKAFGLAAPESQVFDSRVPSLPGFVCSLTFFREVMSRLVTDLKVPKWNIPEPPHRLHCPSISNPVRSWWWAYDYPVCGSTVADVEVQAASPHTLGWSWVGGGWVGNMSGPNYQCVLRKSKWVLILCALSHCSRVWLSATLWTAAC